MKRVVWFFILLLVNSKDGICSGSENSIVIVQSTETTPVIHFPQEEFPLVLSVNERTHIHINTSMCRLVATEREIARARSFVLKQGSMLYAYCITTGKVLAGTLPPESERISRICFQECDALYFPAHSTLLGLEPANLLQTCSRLLTEDRICSGFYSYVKQQHLI